MDNKKKIILARIVSHLMCDGCVTIRYLRYNNQNKTLINNFKKYFIEIFPLTHFIEGVNNSETFFVQVQNKNILNLLFSIVQDFRSQYLRFPKIFDSQETKKEFISALFDDEGCVGLRLFEKTNEIKRNLEVASKSKDFLEDIKYILEKDFKIKCNKLISFKRNFNTSKIVFCVNSLF